MTERTNASIDLPTFDVDKLVELAKDAVYVTVGVGVLAFQKAQVRRRELVKLLDERIGSGKPQLEDLVKSFETRMKELDQRFVEFESKLDTMVEQAESRLPEPAGEALHKAYDVARTARQQVRELLHKAA